eukprot:1154256-Pelagomonas_calceolata.AAC.3
MPWQIFCSSLYKLHLRGKWDEGWKGLSWLKDSCYPLSSPFTWQIECANPANNPSLVCTPVVLINVEALSCPGATEYLPAIWEVEQDRHLYI